MKNLKLLSIFVSIFALILALNIVAYAEYDDYYDCDEEGHDIYIDWDEFWEEYFDYGVTEVYAYCEECYDEFYGEAEVDCKVATKATTSSNGKMFCSAYVNIDGEDYYDNYDGYDTIYKASSISLSKTEYTYTGEYIKPSVTVKDSKGNKISSSNYSLTYSNNKNVGTGTVKITFKGSNYSGSVTKSFKIIPQKPTLSSVSGKLTSATVKWSKQTAQVSGFRIQYSTSSSFSSGVKTVTVTDTSLTSKTITGLTGNKTYYFRIQAYKTVSGTNYYSAYSSAKSVKTSVITLSATSVSLYSGQTKQVKATSYSSKATVTWKSSNTSVAKVSSKGVITAVGKGSATISASVKYSGTTYKATCNVKVTSPSISLNKTSATIYAGRVKKLYSGGTVTLSATTVPSGRTVSWSSSSTSIATVSSSGKVTAKKAGTAKITAKFSYGGKTYSKVCTITVKSKRGITINGVGDNASDSYYVEKPNITVTNNTNCNIVRIEFKTYFLDSSGYIVYDENGYRSTSLNANDIVLKPGVKNTYYWDSIYFNSQVHATAIKEVYVYYSDGTVESFDHSTVYWDSCCY